MDNTNMRDELCPYNAICRELHGDKSDTTNYIVCVGVDKCTSPSNEFYEGMETGL